MRRTDSPRRPRARSRGLALALLVAFGLGACNARRESPPARRAFYYWRTTFALSDLERRALADLHIDRIYVRAFDVVWDGAAKLAGELVVQTPLPAGIDIVPVVFIRDEALAKGIASDIAKQIAAELHALQLPMHEVQLDCDWTDKTQSAFFSLVRELHREVPVMSATIRLHQVKFRERTGVPPVERGTLMFYNMGTFSADPDARVIFDAASAQKYLERISSYPLPLDVALPIWSWVLQIRDGRVVDLMQSTDPDELPKLDFLRADGDHFIATRTAFLHGVLLREGDVLKVEVTGPAETLQAANMVAAHLPPVESPRTVTLFDLSERNLTRHGTQALDQVFRAVR